MEVVAPRPNAEIAANNPPFQYNYNAPKEESKQESSGWLGGWFSGPTMDKLVSTGNQALKQGTSVLSTMGTAMQQKLEQAGVNTESVTTFVSGAAEKTVQVSTQLYQTSAEKFSEL